MNTCPQTATVDVLPGTSPFTAFLNEHLTRADLGGLSLADAACLDGCREEECGGYIQIRTDLPAELYLEVPFVRSSYRFIEALSRECTARLTAADSRPAVQTLRTTGHDAELWAASRGIYIDGTAARGDDHRLIRLLRECGFIYPAGGSWAITAASSSLRYVSVGEYYRDLFFRMLNRAAWTFDDGFPELSFIRRNALFMVLVMGKAREGVTAYDLADVLFVIARAHSHAHAGAWKVAAEGSSPAYWIDDRRLIAAVIQSRFFHRIARMLGLSEPVDGQATSGLRRRGGAFDVLPTDAQLTTGCDTLTRPYRLTPFCRRVLCRQI